MTLQEAGLGHQSGDTRHDTMPHELHHADDEAPTGGVPELTLLDQSLDYHTDHPRKGVGRLQAWRVDLEATTP